MDQIADQGVWAWIMSHKIILAVAVVVVLFGAGYLMGKF